MDWGDVAQTVKKVAGVAAPLLGTVLAGPMGGAAGKLLASVFGCDATPDQVAAAVATDPQAALKLKEIESNNALELQKAVLVAETNALVEDTKRILSVNETMRGEAAAEHWPTWAWRPFWGFVSGGAFLVVCVLVCTLAYQAVLGGKPEAINMIPQLVFAFVGLFGIPAAILGVASWHRGMMQRQQACPSPAPAGKAPFSLADVISR